MPKKTGKAELVPSAREEASRIEKMLAVQEVDYVISDCLGENDAVALKGYFTAKYPRFEVELRGSSHQIRGYENKYYHLIVRRAQTQDKK